MFRKPSAPPSLALAGTPTLGVHAIFDPLCALRVMGTIRFMAATAAISAFACSRSEMPREPPPPPAAEERTVADAGSAASSDGDANSDVGAAAEADAALAPIPPAPLFTNLAVREFPDVVVSVPNGATSPRPIVVVFHGTADRPDWNCDAWRHMTGARGFVLCPSGHYEPGESTPDDRRYTLRGPAARLRAYVDAAIAALAERFAGYVDADRPIATGFSLGATEIAQVALLDPARFPRVAQLDGGDRVWTPANVVSFAARGGRRVLFGCGSPACLAPAKRAAAALAEGGVEARIAHAAVGHTIDRPLQDALMRELPWFLAGDPRWSDAP